MKLNVLDELKRRGFIQQVTDSELLYELLGKEKITFYIGFDPTSDSLHVGHLMGVMAMTHMQHYGHRPIAVVGGGTAMVGDPSGKTKMRQMLTREQIVANTAKIKNQLSRYLDFSNGKAILIDNYEWLGTLNYIDFLRDIGRHFSVNRMLTFETYKRRMETGLSFLEFNYQLLQSYDFYQLYKNYDCRLQMGGDDQWANIISGTDLVRRMEGANVYGQTFPLITTTSGAKMGKTESGALWLDGNKTPPFDYYQYWINIDDADVIKFLSFFTLLPMDEIESIKNLKDTEFNIAKTILAYEATALSHGEKAANEAMTAAFAAFGKREIPKNFLPSSTIQRGTVKSNDKMIPSISMTEKVLNDNPRITDICGDYKLTSSRGEAKRLVQQGGIYVNDVRVNDVDATLSIKDIVEGKINIRLGKKKIFFLLVTK